MLPVEGKPETLDDIIKGPKGFYDPNIFGPLDIDDKQMNQFSIFCIVVLAKELKALKERLNYASQ